MILRAMETVVSNHISELDKDMAKAVILLASSEMTKVKVCGCQPSPHLPPACQTWPWLRGFFPRPFYPSMLGCGFVSGCRGIRPSVLHTDCPPGWAGSLCHFRGGN